MIRMGMIAFLCLVAMLALPMLADAGAAWAQVTPPPP
jgi:hypothetical protein